MIGHTISHYKILEKLGEGGMGVVYKAHDLELDRFVAIKALPDRLVEHNTEQQRFFQEAKAASALNHPHVCTIHDFLKFEHKQFIVMEYVEGRTLREVIRMEMPSTDIAIEYAIQISEALEEAHSKGVVHRDIKPDNIMVNTKNRIKVMDFGLAKLKGSLKLTRTSSTVGTLAYMAPEQIQGGDVDARSDIFSLGIILYEMLCGHSPFKGEHEAALMYSILNEEPESVAKYRPGLPSELLHILDRALEKDPEERYQSVHDLLIDLRRLKKQSTKATRTGSIRQPEIRVTQADETPSDQQALQSPLSLLSSFKHWRIFAIASICILVAAFVYLFLMKKTLPLAESPTEKKMLAVLPFENLGSPDQEYFADGMTEEITSRLAGVSGLGVIARSSARQYKKTAKTLQQISDELHVGYILQGSIRYGKLPDGSMKVRVSPALVKVSDGTEVWSEPYEATFSDVFKMQADLATQVASAMGVTLLQEEQKELNVRPTDNVEAYNYYLHGNEYYDRSYNDEPDIRLSIQMFERALALDHGFAQAYARVSLAHSTMYWFYYDHSPQRLSVAKQMADQAISLNPSLPAAHVALGYYYYWGKLDYDNALKELSIARRSVANDASILYAIGLVQRRQGKFEQAAKSLAEAASLDPRSMKLSIDLGSTYHFLRNYPAAEHEFQRAVSLNPGTATPYVKLARTYLLWDGATDRAKTTMQQCPPVHPSEDADPLLYTIDICILDGNYAGALERLESTSCPLAFDLMNIFLPKSLIQAEIYGLTGQRDKKLAAYDSARLLIEHRLAMTPDDARLHTALGIALAGLGDYDNAVREARGGVELLPLSKDALNGQYRIYDLARVEMMAGKADSAIENIQLLLSRPGDFSPQFIRLDPIWVSLRSNPKFQKVVRWIK